MDSFFIRKTPPSSLIILSHHIEQNYCLVLVDIHMVKKISPNNNQLLDHWLSPEEKLYLKQFRFNKRYNEWLSGRIAVKWGLSKRMGDSFQPAAHTILPDQYGCPQLRPIRDGQHISISHSHQFCTALIADTPCGIDIQKIKRQILRVREKIAAEIEINMVKRAVKGNEEAALTIIWAAKETVKKKCLSTRPGLFAAIKIQSLKQTGQQTPRWTVNCLIADPKHSQDVNIVRLDNYMLAWSATKTITTKENA